MPRPLEHVQEGDLRSIPAPTRRRAAALRATIRKVDATLGARTAGAMSLANAEHGEHGTCGLPNHFLGHRSQHEVCKTTRAVGSHDDQVSGKTLGALEDIPY